jgi:putative transposase
VLEGIVANIGSIGDAYDNAQAETKIGLLETEAIGRRSPFLAGSLRCPSDNGFRVVEYTNWADLCRRSRINLIRVQVRAM